MSGGMIKTDTSDLADKVMTVNGDMVDFAGGVRSRLPIGSEDQIMTVSAGLLPNWETATAGGATITTQNISFTNSQTTTSASLTAITGSGGVLASRVSGKAFLCQTLCFEANAAAVNAAFGFVVDGATVNVAGSTTHSNGSANSITTSAMTDLDGGAVSALWRCNTGTLTLANDGANNWSHCNYFEVS